MVGIIVCRFVYNDINGRETAITRNRCSIKFGVWQGSRGLFKSIIVACNERDMELQVREKSDYLEQLLGASASLITRTRFPKYQDIPDHAGLVTRKTAPSAVDQPKVISRKTAPSVVRQPI
eukprot:scaffold363_cov56-Cylindrotheca_fusiformis.AAC.36